MRTLSEIADSSWIGTFPKNWDMLPIKSLFNFSKGLNITKEDLTDNGSKVISYGQIHAKDNNKTGIHFGMVRYVSKEKTLDAKNAIVHKGGFIFADTSEDLDGVGNCAYNDSDKEIFGGYHTIVLNPIKDTDNKYFAYLFQTDAWRIQLRRQLVDVKVFSVNQGILSETYLIIPPKLVQKAIVSYLDFHCKKIDESIKRHQEIIEKLEKYRVSIITQAVTKGIKQDVELKESNEIWIGKVPSNWNLWKLKYTVNLRKEKCMNRPYIGLENVESRSACFLGYGECDSEALLVKPGDVIFSKLRPYLSKTLLIKEEASCNGEFLVMTPLLFESEYLKYVTLSSSFVDRVNGSSYGVKMPRASWNFVGNLIVPLPSREEQRSIVSYLNKICFEIDQAKNKALEVITKLETYRQSLVYSAVTGKISCTGGAL